MKKDLEIRHCRVLLAVSEHGGIAAAARSLGLAQSTVSETLMSLERVAGSPATFRRRGHEATLTPAAEALLPHARALVAASEAALEVFTKGSGQGVLRLGAVESISSYLLPRPLSAFRAKWPAVDVRITIGLCEDLRKHVHRQDLDAALSIEGEQVEDQGWHRNLSPSKLTLVASPGNPLAGNVVDREVLGSATLLLADPDGAFNRLLRAWFDPCVNRPKFGSAGSIDGVKRGVLNSDSIGVLPAYAVADELASGELVEISSRENLPGIAVRLTSLNAPVPSSPLHNLVEEVRKAFAATDAES